MVSTVRSRGDQEKYRIMRNEKRTKRNNTKNYVYPDGSHTFGRMYTDEGNSGEEGNLPHYLDESNRLDQEISGGDGLQEDDSDQGDSTKDDSDGDDLKEDITDENEFEKNDSDTNDSGADGSTEDDSNEEPRDQSRLAMFLVGMRELN